MQVQISDRWCPQVCVLFCGFWTSSAMSHKEMHDVQTIYIYIRDIYIYICLHTVFFTLVFSVFPMFLVEVFHLLNNR